MAEKPPPTDNTKPTTDTVTSPNGAQVTQDDRTLDLVQSEKTAAERPRAQIAPEEEPAPASPPVESPSPPPPRWSQVWDRVAQAADDARSSSSVELPVGSGTSSLTTDRAVGVALQHTESARAGGFAWVSGGIALAALLPLPWLGGVAAEKIACALALTAIIGVSIWVQRRARRPGGYTGRVALIHGGTCVAMLPFIELHLGVFSPTVFVLTMGFAHFGMGNDRRAAGTIWLVGTLGWLFLALAQIGDLIGDHGLISAGSTPVLNRLFFVFMVPLVLTVTYLQAVYSRRMETEAYERVAEAERRVSQKDAQLAEAKLDLDAARKAVAGGAGAHTGALAGTFRLGALLGRGTTGEVYAAREAESGQVVAVKVLSQAQRAKERALRRFEREGQTLARLNSPHIVAVRDVGQLEDGAPYITMEHLEGEDLGSMLRRRGSFSAEELLPVLSEVTAGLEAAHEAGVIHRDLKPQHIFCDTCCSEEPRWKLLDFGIAKLTFDASSLTGDHAIGTPSYMAPEQALGLGADKTSDLFALGAIIYRALCGRMPFWAPDVPVTMYRVAWMNPERPRSAAPELSSDLELFLAIALSKVPVTRYATPRALLDAFRDAQRDQLPRALRAHAKVLLAQHPWGATLRREIGEMKPSSFAS